MPDKNYVPFSPHSTKHLTSPKKSNPSPHIHHSSRRWISLIVLLGGILGISLSVLYQSDVSMIQNLGSIQVSDVTFPNLTSVRVNFMVPVTNGVNLGFSGNITVNNWTSPITPSLLTMVSSLTLIDIPSSSILPFFQANNCSIHLYGVFTKTKGSIHTTDIIDLNWHKSFIPSISCNYHPYGNSLDTTFVTTLTSPVTSGFTNCTMAYNLWINVTQQEINDGLLKESTNMTVNMTLGWHSVGNVSLQCNFTTTMVLMNDTMHFDFYVKPYTAPDALWTYVIDNRLAHQQQNLTTVAPLVRVTDIHLHFDDILITFPELWAVVHLV